MKNEIHRKLTSIILATIMVAGGVTFAIPGAIPEAAAQSSNANLYVSAENSAFDNVFSGLNIIEVVVRDSDRTIRSGPDIAAEPRVEVDGNQLRMVQGSDGNWYGYFAENNTRAVKQTAIDYNSDDCQGVVESDINGKFESDHLMCAIGGEHPVIKTPKAINRADGSENFGSIGLSNADRWPFIQVYAFDDESDIVVEYQKGAGTQSVTLYYDSDPDEYGTGLELGRDRYPQNGGVIMTMTDLAMNVDPTEEDTWTFDTTGSEAAYYYVFDDDGVLDNTPPTTAIDPELEGIDDNLYLTINRNAENAEVDAVEIIEEKKGNQNTGREQMPNSPAVQDMEHIVTFIETGSNTGVFTNTDSDSDTPNVVVSENAKRGTSAVVDHNDSTQSVVVGHTFATISFDDDAVGGVWNSGEEIPVTLTDADVNRKAMADEDIDVSDDTFTIVPSIRVGNPITLGNSDMAQVGNMNLTDDNDGLFIDDFSDIARITPSESTNSNEITFKSVTTVGELDDFLSKDTTPAPATFQFINVDVRSTDETLNNVRYQWMDGNMMRNVNMTLDTDQDLVDVTKDMSINLAHVRNVGDDVPVDVVLRFSDNVSLDDDTTYPIVVDLFRFGQMGDGVAPADRLNDAIYRLELEESGDNTGVFEGTVEYIMLNQINVRNSETYDDVDPISDGVIMIVHNDLTDEDSIRVNYLDLGADGVPTQVADQVEAPTTSGAVSFDADNYKVADTVTVTLEDADLNTAVDTIDIYTVVTQVYNSGNPPTFADSDDIERWSKNPDSVLSMDGYLLQLSNASRTETALFRDIAFDQVGAANYGANTAGDNFGRVLDITFDDQLWLNGCGIEDDNGLGSTGFTLIETGSDTGVFTGDFQVPYKYCHRTTDSRGVVTQAVEKPTTGVDMEVNYVDYRDASGEGIEVGDSAGIRANTGTVSLDRTVYPVPFGVPNDFMMVDSNSRATYPDRMSIFPIHESGRDNVIRAGSFIDGGDLTIHVRINDPDFDISASGEDTIAETVERNGQSTHGPLKVTVSRGADEVILATAGGPEANNGRITKLGATNMIERIGNTNEFTSRTVTVNDVIPSGPDVTRELGPITEIAPDAGIFELDLSVRYTDGPASRQCPATSSFVPLNGEPRIYTDNSESAKDRFTDSDATHCILQGDILTVEYTDPTDASGKPNSVTDSATFDLRNGVLQSDKSVYIIGQDMILTLIEPDLDLENDEAETYTLDLIQWDSDAAALSMGAVGGSNGAFDPEPSDLRETGDSTGIFQVVVEIPEELNGDRIERGEEIELEYTDWGPSGADYVGDDTEDINLTVFTSNFGATIELDQKVYTWTDKVYITIVAPDHNFDSDLVDEIGETDDPIRVSTRGAELEPYRLVETGTDTGIFAGEVILTGFAHDADGDTTTGDRGLDVIDTGASGTGPTDGKLPAGDDDGITVSFEFSEDQTVVQTALIRWSIGEVQWLETSYPAQGTGIVRVIDRDMNLDPESVDNFDVDVYSDSDSGGIDLTVTETNEATGVFEGTVFFTTTDESSGHRLRVAEGDTISAEYTDGTLPNPYSTNDDIDVTAAAIIGTIVPPLERAPVSNARVVDSFGNTLSSVSVDQQVQITADVINGQDRTQSFAYLVQIQDANGVTVSLSWIEGSLNPGQSLSPAQSWTPDMPGSYTATVFVWESVDNPTALSPPGTVTVNVR